MSGYPNDNSQRNYEDLKVLVETMRLVGNPDEANIALACRLAGGKNFALVSGEIATGKRTTLLDHLGKTDRILVLVRPHMTRLWQEEADEQGCKAEVQSYHRIVHRSADSATLDFIKQFDRLVIEDAHGDKTCKALNVLVKESGLQTIYVASTAGDPLKAARDAAKVTGRDTTNYDWMVVANSNISSRGRTL